MFHILYHNFIYCSYASRVKLITNQASKNSDNKEIARLKSVSIYTYSVKLDLVTACEFESRSGGGVQHYLMKFVNNL